MIIYGTRMYGRKNQVRSHGRCPHCGKVGTLKSYDGRKWGHLYFIPLIPAGGKVRVLRECARCNTGSHIPVEKLPDLATSIQKTLDDAVVALGARETEMTVAGQTLPAISVLCANIDDVYCLVGEREIAQLLANLKAVNDDEALLLAEARVAELKSELKKAEAKYGELVARGNHPTILYQAARFHHEQEQFPRAITLAERLETILATDLGVKQLLIDCYLATNAWAKLATTYESCFLLAPDLKKQKPILKAYQKACKKAGRPPQP